MNCLWCWYFTRGFVIGIGHRCVLVSVVPGIDVERRCGVVIPGMITGKVRFGVFF